MKDIILSESLSIITGVLAGAVLVSVRNEILRYPSILIALPGLLQMRGSVGGILASKMGTELHLGTMNKKKLFRMIASNILSSFIASLVVSSITIPFSNDLKPFFVVFLAGFLSSIVEIPLIVIPEEKLFKKGIDPDSVMGPYLTSIDDLITTSLLGVLLWVF